MTLRLIGVPVVISLGVIVVRLFGELAEASPILFSQWPEAPGHGFAFRAVAVSWLALPFGAHFARRLMERGDGPRSVKRAALIAGVALLCLYPVPMLASIGVAVYAAVVLSSLVALAWTWPALARTMAAYALPVGAILVAVILFAWTAGWGTHYDLQSIGPRIVPSLLHPHYFRGAALWLATTMLAGLLAGSLTALAWRSSHPSAAIAA